MKIDFNETEIQAMEAFSVVTAKPDTHCRMNF